MTFDAATAIDTAKTAYNANADYAAEQSTTKALTFQTACTQLIGLLPAATSRGGQGGSSVETEVSLYREMLDRVSAWLNTNADSTRSDANSPPRALSFADFRS